MFAVIYVTVRVYLLTKVLKISYPVDRLSMVVSTNVYDGNIGS